MNKGKEGTLKREINLSSQCEPYLWKPLHWKKNEIINNNPPVISLTILYCYKLAVRYNIKLAKEFMN